MNQVIARRTRVLYVVVNHVYTFNCHCHVKIIGRDYHRLNSLFVHWIIDISLSGIYSSTIIHQLHPGEHDDSSFADLYEVRPMSPEIDSLETLFCCYSSRLSSLNLFTHFEEKCETRVRKV